MGMKKPQLMILIEVILLKDNVIDSFKSYVKEHPVLYYIIIAGMILLLLAILFNACVNAGESFGRFYYNITH